MKVGEFEEKVWAVEGVRVVVRAPLGQIVQDYGYQNAAPEGWRITQLMAGRIAPCLDGTVPFGGVVLRNLRETYA